MHAVEHFFTDGLGWREREINTLSQKLYPAVREEGVGESIMNSVMVQHAVNNPPTVYLHYEVGGPTV